MKTIFMGTPEFSVLPLKALMEKTEVLAVVTQPDKKVGRKQKVVSSPVKEIAIENNIKVIQPIKIKTEYQEILDLKPDLVVTCAYGQIIPKEILDFPKHKCINIHASLLPNYRGGAPIHRSIYNGDEETGITIMYMDQKMDSGDIIEQKAIPIEKEDNLETMHNKLSKLGSEMITKTIDDIESRKISSIKQDETKVTYAYNIKREEEELDFNRTSKEIFNHVRAFNPWPGTYFKLGDIIIKVWEVEEAEDHKKEPGIIVEANNKEVLIQTKNGAISLKTIQPFGKKKMNIKDYMNGKGKEVLTNGKKVG
jgi:methionyl-tRNA formyltransferase